MRAFVALLRRPVLTFAAPRVEPLPATRGDSTRGRTIQAPQEAPRSRTPRSADLLIAALFAAWAVAAVLSARAFSLGDARTLVPIIVVNTILRRLQLGVYARDTSVSLSVAGNLAAGFIAGPSGAFICTAATYLLAWDRQYKLRGVLFNISSQSLSNGAAAACFALATRLFSGATLPQVAGALSGSAVSFMGESALMSLILAITQRRGAVDVWRERFQWALPHWIGLGLVALAVALAYEEIGIVGLLAFTGPALLMRYSMKQYLDRTARSVEELRRRNEALAAANDEIASMSSRLQETYAGTLEALVSALDARDQETHGHSARVSRFTMMLARQLGVPEGTPEWSDIERGALLHDVGKIGVPDAILRKAGKLTEDEWITMRRHPEIGWEMLKDIPFLAGAAAIVASHHERWDGRGYPLGLKGEEIPLGARIFAVADTFDAMASDRPYRQARPYPECLAEIERCAGTQFDPAVVEALHAIYPRWIEEHQRAIRESAERLSVVA